MAGLVKVQVCSGKEFHHRSGFSDGHGRALDHLRVYDLLSLSDGRAGCLWFHDQEKACVQLQSIVVYICSQPGSVLLCPSLYAALLQFTSAN